MGEWPKTLDVAEFPLCRSPCLRLLIDKINITCADQRTTQSQKQSSQPDCKVPGLLFHREPASDAIHWIQGQFTFRFVVSEHDIQFFLIRATRFLARRLDRIKLSRIADPGDPVHFLAAVQPSPTITQ
jgi:hypothetical protein